MSLLNEMRTSIFLWTKRREIKKWRLVKRDFKNDYNVLFISSTVSGPISSKTKLTISLITSSSVFSVVAESHIFEL